MRVSSATSTRIMSSPEPGTCCIGPPVAQVPASSKNRTGQTSERKNKFAATPDFLEPELEKNFVLSGEVNVNQRQDDNGATGTTPRSLSQVPRGCNGTVKVFATFVYTFLTNGLSRRSMLQMVPSVTCLNRRRIGLISCCYSLSFN